MFISSRDGDSFWRHFFAKPPKVILNGAEVCHVIEAEDGPSGRIVRYIVDENGNYATDGDEFATVEENGYVELVGQRI